jgi:hypothetical protein
MRAEASGRSGRLEWSRAWSAPTSPLADAGGGLVLWGWIIWLGCVPGAVGVSLSCDDDVGAACHERLSMLVRQRDALRGVADAVHHDGLVAQLVRAHA